mmetsp:Transcript_62462/g.101150  ORF Transcript_62462/g.101150 Transcript_62462/m.101150 type:complete len:217 (+) Transcript_62462:444-1094(+)
MNFTGREQSIRWKRFCCYSRRQEDGSMKPDVSRRFADVSDGGCGLHEVVTGRVKVRQISNRQRKDHLGIVTRGDFGRLLDAFQDCRSCLPCDAVRGELEVELCHCAAGPAAHVVDLAAHANDRGRIADPCRNISILEAGVSEAVPEGIGCHKLRVAVAGGQALRVHHQVAQLWRYRICLRRRHHDRQAACGGMVPENHICPRVPSLLATQEHGEDR